MKSKNILCFLIVFSACKTLSIDWYSIGRWRNQATRFLDRAGSAAKEGSAWLYAPFRRWFPYLREQQSPPSPKLTYPVPALPISKPLPATSELAKRLRAASSSSSIFGKLPASPTPPPVSVSPQSLLAKNFECEYPNFASWDTMCRTLKRQIPWGPYMLAADPTIILRKGCFLSALEKCIEISKKLLDEHEIGVEKSGFKPFVGKLELPNDSIIAFHGDLHGDVHSLNVFIRKLQKDKYMSSEDGFKIKDPQFYMVFLGDYTDRGAYGMEVIYTIIRLKLANPERVFLVRGNHEELRMNKKPDGFEWELRRKIDLMKRYERAYPSDEDLQACLTQLGYFYNTMPVALYIGTKDNESNHKDFILCCHGGIEIGFDANVLLESDHNREYMFVGALKRKGYLPKYSQSVQDEIKAVQKKIEIGQERIREEKKDVDLKDYLIDERKYSPDELGFMWNDFQVDPEEPLGYKYGRGLLISKSLLDDHLETRSRENTYSLKGVFRAHQHSPKVDPIAPMMARILNKDEQSPIGEEGVGKIWGRSSKSQKITALWPGIVVTFLVSPVTPYSVMKLFDYDAFGILKLAPKFENWQLEVVRTDKNEILNY